MAIRETAQVVDIPLPEFPDLTTESMDPKEKLTVRAVTAMGAHTAIYKNVRDVQLKNTQERCCTDQWLDENEREWMILDALCRSRPWAVNKDKAFAYPFREATDRMRQVEGPWVGDNDPFCREWTRESAVDEVLFNIKLIPEYPPARRLLIFTPEFGSADSFQVQKWSELDADLWVVSWQGWTVWEEMIEQVTRQVLSLADGVSTTWYGHSMGALVAYEVLKRFETRYRSP